MIKYSFVRTRQKGAAMVEMAVILLLFLILVFGIMEFAWLIFEWAKQTEATRAGARLAIVHKPACNLYGDTDPTSPLVSLPACTGGVIDCTTAGVSVGLNCDGQTGGCAGVVEEMQKLMPRITAANVDISYECANVGDPDVFHPPVSVTVSASGVQHPLFLPGLIIEPEDDSDGTTITIPAFSTTRVSEDMYTRD